jgi:hypothetical protein
VIDVLAALRKSLRQVSHGQLCTGDLGIRQPVR